MAEGERLGASFSIDVTNLKTGLLQANRLIRESESEFKKAAAGMDDWTKSEEGLTAKIKSLSDITKIQKEKVSALKGEYKKLIDEGLDPTSAKAVKYRTQINNEEAALKKNEAELKKQKDALKNVGDETEETSEKTGKFAEVAKNAAKVAAAAFAAVGAAMVSVVKSAIESYADYEQLVGGVDTLFENSSQKVQDYAANAYKTAGLSANEYMETVTGFSAALISSLGGDTEKAAKYADMAITDMSDNANKMGSDIESIKNAYGGFAKGNFTMLDNLKLGYGGTQEEMKRLLADAEKISGVHYDISSYSDVVAAIHEVQTNLKISGISAEEAAEAVKSGAMTEEEALAAMGTTAKEASTTISGSIFAMKSAWQNMLTGIADKNADFDLLVNNLIESIETAAKNLIPVIKTAVQGVIKMVDKLLPQITKLVADLLPDVLSGVMSMINSIIEALPMIVDGIISFLPQLTGAIAKMLPLLIDACVNILISLINGLTALYPQLVEQLITLIPQLINSIIAAIPQILQAAIQLLMAIVDAVPVIVEQLIGVLPSIIQTIITAVLEAFPMLINAAIQLFNALIDAIPVIIVALTENLPLIIETIINALITALPLVLNGAIQLLMAIINAIPVIVNLLVAEMPKISTAVISALVKNMPMLLSAALQFFSGIGLAIPKVIGQLVKQVPAIGKAIIEGLKQSLKNIGEIGTNVVKGLWNGISDMTAWIAKKIRGFGDSVVTGLKNFFGIKSPSKLMENVVGKNLALGIGKGFEDNIGAVNDKITSAMQLDGININANATGNGGGVTVYQTNNYSQAHSRLELYKTKQQTAAAVRLAMGAV